LRRYRGCNSTSEVTALAETALRPLLALLIAVPAAFVLAFGLLALSSAM